MMDRSDDEVDSDKNKSDGITKSISNNLLTSIGSNSSLSNAMPCIDMEDWDEVFTAKDLREIPVAKTNCIPIIPKRYRKLIADGKYRPNILKKDANGEGDNDKKIMTLNDHLKRFDLLESEHDLFKETPSTSTQLNKKEKPNPPASEAKGKDKKPKTVLWSPNLVRHTSIPDETPISDSKTRRSSINERRRSHTPNFSHWHNGPKSVQKPKLDYAGSRPPIQNLINKLTTEPERKSRFYPRK